MSKKPVIIFEGVEGSGKTHHILRVAKYLKNKKLDFIKIREPGGNLNSGRKNPGSAGTQTANLVYGGDQPATDITESYNGSTWTEVADLNTGRRCNPGLGTQTTAIQAGGSPPTVAIVESFDGSSWTEIADLNTARDAGAGSVGTSTAGLIVGGHPGLAVAETWDGSSWTEVGDLNEGRQGVAVFGTSTS